jgi:Gliding motility associated protein GldN
MNNRMKFLSFLLVFVGLATASFSQQDTIVNPNSTEKIPYYEQLYRFRVWRTIDMKEKQNEGFKSAKSDLSQFLLKSIQSGAIPVYNDSLTSTLKPEEVVVSNKAVMEPPFDTRKSYFINETASYNGKNYESTRNDNVGHLPTDPDWWQVSINQTLFLTNADQGCIMTHKLLAYWLRRVDQRTSTQSGMLNTKISTTLLRRLHIVRI